MSMHNLAHSSQRRRPLNELTHLVLALAAERAVEGFWWRRLIPCRDRNRALLACRRFGGFDLGGQNVPVLIAERLRDQLQSFGMCGFDSLSFQGIAQSARHSFRVAEIAHESTSSSANGKDRGLPCRPVRQWRGCGEK